MAPNHLQSAEPVTTTFSASITTTTATTITSTFTAAAAATTVTSAITSTNATAITATNASTIASTTLPTNPPNPPPMCPPPSLPPWLQMALADTSWHRSPTLPSIAQPLVAASPTAFSSSLHGLTHTPSLSMSSYLILGGTSMMAAGAITVLCCQMKNSLAHGESQSPLRRHRGVRRQRLQTEEPPL
eukprot:CAMPEP_0119320714 /NCGR_PEP_ID=MMETSP1333-20130426/53198_1 /TAXON_ID=418940 /ORGANISM="Scyphosphaera apsteinii, Strain RCC1455" /LENGTH=186 /DNA_ID=CAMNT_0007327491 /DNA_START=299 /DNA_END=860 /DNA_ORIENTATION=+